PPTVRKFILSALFAALAVTSLSSTVFAWGKTFGYFVGGPRWRRCCHDGFSLCVRPYNAFSPVASGSLYFDGIQPTPTAPPTGFGYTVYGGIPYSAPNGVVDIGMGAAVPVPGPAPMMPSTGAFPVPNFPGSGVPPMLPSAAGIVPTS